MWNKVLWTIDNGLDSRSFERLCIDLLYRNGYREIAPVEPQDGGRDAQEFPRQGRGRSGEAAFFQFSLEDDWRAKLRRDARTLADRGYKFSTLVFVTSQKARGVDIDSLEAELRQKFGWELVVHSREWLRFQLEEAHPDLAKKYLGVEVPDWSAHLTALMRLKKPPNEHQSEAWAALEAEDYDRAAVAFRNYVDEQPESPQAWQALAWCQYSTHRYDEALASINQALELGEDPQALSIRACILAEKGIADGSKRLLIEARHLFERLVESGRRPVWLMLYNLANVQTALGEHKEAITRYRRALELEAGDARIWKNLGTAYHLVGDHDAEMECLDKSLEIDPLKPEALASKGISLLVDFRKPQEAAALLERAVRFNPDWAVHWPQVWYWVGEAHRLSGLPTKALEWVEDGLAHQPDHPALKRLKSELLTNLLPGNPDLAPEATRFWQLRLMEEPLDFDVRARLVRREQEDGNEPSAWNLLEECFELLDLEPAVPLETSGFSIDECARALRFLPQYRVFRRRYPVSDYWIQGDPLYDLAFAPPLSPTVKDALATYLAVPFGLGFAELEEAAIEKREQGETVRAFFDSLRSRMEQALVEGARGFVDLIPPRAEDSEAMVDKVTEIILFLGLIGLREFGRQRGWIASQFRVSPEAMDRVLDSYDEGQIESNVVSKAFVILSEVAGFLPESG